MQSPQQYTARLEEKKVLNDKFVQYSFELENPHILNFSSGQYVSLQVTEKGERRSYSICSSPGITHGFELLVDITPNGLGVQFLNSLQFGQSVSLLAPMGRFVLQSPEAVATGSEDAVAFIATGSGIAPFRSMILDLLQERHDTRPIRLYWGLRRVEDLIWQDEFQDLVDFFPNFQFHPVLSQASEEWPLCRGRVTDCLSVHPQLSQKTGYYLCGSNAMIEDVKQLLAAKAVVPESIHHEMFY